MRRWRTLAWLAGAATIAGAVGFCVFLTRLAQTEIVLHDKADGIVVLTGGASRVNDAMELLAAGHAQRLLISGVHPMSSTGELSRMLPEYQRLLACCVDLDHFARNTRGNAIEARRWVHERSLQSLIVVTSNYHMPRALAEFSHVMPGVALTPFPVVGERWKSEPWWSNGGIMRLVMLEYVKYVFAEARIALGGLGLFPEREIFAASMRVPPAAPPRRSAFN
ncbi:MAG: YdcF family protein [Xanthobacteraceae bacterium]|nr:MAG: YdcF family protein [Xanthobacteraceae bacterium]